MARTDRSLTLAPLRVRSFRFQFPADLLTSWAFEMETLILGWYVMVGTGSVMLLTVFGSLQLVGTLAAPMFGVLGDRLGGRFMLCAMRGTYAVLAGTLMVLGLADVLSPTAVFVVATLGGIVRPNDQLMRNALIGDTIPRAQLVGALGMSRITMDSARIAGALAGAGLSSALGLGRAYACITALYLASLALTFGVSGMRPVGADPARGAASPSLPHTSSWQEMLDGLAYVWQRPVMLAMMWMAFLVNLIAYPISGGLLPYIARNVFQVDAGGLGWLVAAFAFGALLGSIGMVISQGPRQSERTMLVYSAVWLLLLLGFGQVRDLTAGMLVLVLAGLAQSIAMISLSASLLHAADDNFRGRVMGVRMLAVYGMPIGLMGAGALIDTIGYRATVSLLCLGGIAATGLIASRWRAHVREA